MPHYDYNAAKAAHEAGLLDGTIYAVPEVLPQSFGGQRNFGALGPDRKSTTIPEWGVETSDGWLYLFQSEELAQGFIAAHPKGGTCDTV